MLSILYVNDYQIPVCGSKILNNIAIDLNLITIKYKFNAYEMFILLSSYNWRGPSFNTVAIAYLSFFLFNYLINNTFIIFKIITSTCITDGRNIQSKLIVTFIKNGLRQEQRSSIKTLIIWCQLRVVVYGLSPQLLGSSHQ